MSEWSVYVHMTADSHPLDIDTPTLPALAARR